MVADLIDSANSVEVRGGGLGGWSMADGPLGLTFPLRFLRRFVKRPVRSSSRWVVVVIIIIITGTISSDGRQAITSRSRLITLSNLSDVVECLAPNR